MLQRILVVLGVLNLVAVIVLSVVVFGKQQRVVYVDSAKLLQQYTGMAVARAAYEQKAAGWKANVDTLAHEVQVQIAKYEKEQGAMSVKERTVTRELIHVKQRQLTEYQQSISAQAREEDEKVTGDVLAQVNAYLKKYGEAKGYTIILAATAYGNLAYADEVLDITNDVLNGLNAEYSGK